MGRWIRRRNNYGGTPPELNQDVLDHIIMDFRNFIEKHYYDSRIGMSKKKIASIYDESKLPAVFYKDTVIDLMYNELKSKETKNEGILSRENILILLSIMVSPIVFSLLGFMEEGITRTLLVYYFTIGASVFVITYIIRDSLMKDQNIDRRFPDLLTAAFITTGILAAILSTLILIESTFIVLFLIISIVIGLIMFYYPLLKFPDFVVIKELKNNCTKCIYLKDNICRKFGHYWIEEVALRTTCDTFTEKEKEK